MSKKLVTILAAVMLAFGIQACHKGGGNDHDQHQNTPQTHEDNVMRGSIQLNGGTGMIRGIQKE